MSFFCEIRKSSRRWNPVTQEIDSTHVCNCETEKEALTLIAANPDYFINFNQGDAFLARRISESDSHHGNGPY